MQKRDVESAPTQVIDGDLRFRLQLIESVGQSRGRRFVHDSFHGESSQFAGPLGGVPLRVVEISRHRDDRAVERAPHGPLGVCLQLFQDGGGNFLRRVFAQADGKADRLAQPARNSIGHGRVFLGNLFAAPAHKPLDRVDGGLRPKGALMKRCRSGASFAFLGKMNHRWRQARALLAGDQYRKTRIHDADERVGRAQVDPYDVLHIRIKT